MHTLAYAYRVRAKALRENGPEQLFFTRQQRGHPEDELELCRVCRRPHTVAPSVCSCKFRVHAECGRVTMAENDGESKATFVCRTCYRAI